MANSYSATVTSAKVTAVQGQAWVIDAQGQQRELTANDVIRLNEWIQTADNSVLMLDMGRAALASFGANTKMRFDKAFLAGLDEAEKEGSLQQAISLDAIEQAVAEGRSLDDVLPATAAGGDATNASAGTEGVRIDLIAERVTPESGFETNRLGYDANRTFDPIGGRDSDGVRTVELNPSITIDALSVDDVINAAEKNQPLVISGEATDITGGQVLVTFNGVTYTADVEGGSYSVTIPAADLAGIEDGEYTLSISAPNASASKTVLVDTVVEGGIAFTSTVTPDNVLSVEESNEEQLITGIASGDFTAGDLVTLVINGQSFTGALSADGSFSIAVPGAVLYADPDQRIEASFTATDAAGNSQLITANLGYQIQAPNNMGTLSIAGEPEEGALLTASVSDADGLSSAVTYQWFADGVAIEGASGNQLLLSGDLIGRVISVSATYTDDRGFSETVTAGIAEPVADLLPQITLNDTTITDVDQPTFSGTSANSDGDIVLTVNGKDYTVTPASDGTWSFTIPSADALVDGSYLVSVIASDSQGNSVSASDAFVVEAVDDQSILTLSNGAATEDSTVAGDVIATFTLTDEEGNATVDFTAGSNDDGYYEIVGSEVRLTAAGEAYLDAGNALPNVSLSTNDGVTQTNTVTTTLVNDPIVLSVTLTDPITEDSAVAGDVVAQVSADDEDGGAISYSISDTTNYAIDASSGEVTLTAAGAAIVNGGGDLPNFDVTASSTTGATSTDTVTVNPTDTT
ncbi:retention module-containing protein, partial [Simiduia agarivorans]|uniref:retention module-containing protein n=1 Tax=Simiduia agarivorans TaxID=447471 RepID=UPI0004A5FBA8